MARAPPTSRLLLLLADIKVSERQQRPVYIDLDGLAVCALPICSTKKHPALGGEGGIVVKARVILRRPGLAVHLAVSDWSSPSFDVTSNHLLKTILNKGKGSLPTLEPNGRVYANSGAEFGIDRQQQLGVLVTSPGDQYLQQNLHWLNYLWKDRWSLSYIVIEGDNVAPFFPHPYKPHKADFWIDKNVFMDKYKRFIDKHFKPPILIMLCNGQADSFYL